MFFLSYNELSNILWSVASSITGYVNEGKEKALQRYLQGFALWK